MRRAFSLVELLVVVVILSLLLSLLLPTVQAAREASRNATCRNNLRQLATAIHIHVRDFERFPYGGWGNEWIGMPDRGASERQPGGWTFNILPFLEQEELHALGIGLRGLPAEQAYSRRLMTPLPVFVCPSRRLCSLWAFVSAYSGTGYPRPFGTVSSVSRSDYAINGGSSHALSFPGPPNLAAGDDPLFWENRTYVGKFTGISHLRTSARITTIVDGTSNTYLVGEKMIDPAKYENGLSIGDNDTLFSGFSNDLHRFAGLAGKSPPWLPPLKDGNENIDPRGYLRFGSAHVTGLNMAFCDGSARLLSFDIDPSVHFRAGHRRDMGMPIENGN